MAESENTVVKWLEVAAHIGIVIGLLLVAFQIAQDDDIASANLQADSFSLAVDHYQQTAGEDAAASLAKAIADYEQLDTRDLVILDSLYTAEYIKVVRQEMLFGGPVIAEAAAERWTAGLLTNPYGYAWWESQPPLLDLAPLTKNIIEARLKEAGRDLATQAQARQTEIREIMRTIPALQNAP